MKKFGLSLAWVLSLLSGTLAFAADLTIQQNASVGSYLADAEGSTLYIFTNDVANSGASACYGGCANAWPPFLVNSVDVEGVEGEFSVIVRDDGGLQLTFNGLPLYYFAGDTQAGDITGHESGGVWFVAPYEAAQAAAPVVTEYLSIQENADLGTYLADAAGKSLYIFTNDVANSGSSVCNGGCAGAWPPFLLDSADLVGQSVAGLSVVTRDDGALQLAYQGMPLYYFAGDVNAGDVTGHESGGVWFVAAYEAQAAVPAAQPEATEQSEGAAQTGEFVLKRASKSSTIALSNDDLFVIMVNPQDDSVSIFSTLADLQISKVRTGTEPSAVVIHPDSETAFVANRADATVSKLEGISSTQVRLSATTPVGSEPTGLALSPTGAFLYVAEWAEGRISVIDTATMQVVNSIDNPNRPRSVSVTNDGDADDSDELIVVPEFYGTPISPSSEAIDQTRTGVLRFYNAADLAPAGRIDLAPLDSGFTPEGTNNGPVMTSPNQLYNAVVQGDKVYVPSVSASPDGPPRFNGNVFPVLYVGDIANFREDNSNVGTVNLARKVGDAIPQQNNLQGRFFLADIVDIDFIGTSNVAYALSRGSDVVQRVTFDPVQGTQLGSQFNMQIDINKAPEGSNAGCLNPTGIVTAHDAPRAYVNCWVSRQLGVLDLSRQTLERTISASDAPFNLEASINKGRRFFFTGRARWSKESWSSCSSCHPDGLSDNITWSFGSGPRQTTSLDGSFSKAPGRQEQRIFNWSGIFDEVHDFERNTRGVSGGLGAVTTDGCGDLLEERPLELGANLDQPVREVQDNTVPSCTKDFDDIEAYMKTIRPPKALQTLDGASVARGATLFGTASSSANNGSCVSCHGGLGWTISKRTFEPSSETNAALATTPFDLTSTLIPPSFNFHTTQIAPQPPITDTFTGPVEPEAIGPKQVACVLRNVGTFGVPGDAFATDTLEQKANGSRAQGRGGYNVPSLYGLSLGAPYLHHGQAATLEDLFNDPKWANHLRAGNPVFLTTGDAEQQKQDLISFLLSIDASTTTFSIPLGFDACGF